MNKKELLADFEALKKGVDFDYCFCCSGCIGCVNCNYCHHCHYCSDCNYCVLCVGLKGNTSGYWILNKEVTGEEYYSALRVLT